jgi:hypothetical protein
VSDDSTVPARLERVDLSTGQRALLRELAPPDRAGVTTVSASQWLDDGRGYVYAYGRELSALFVVSGVTARSTR